MYLTVHKFTYPLQDRLFFPLSRSLFLFLKKRHAASPRSRVGRPNSELLLWFSIYFHQNRNTFHQNQICGKCCEFDNSATKKVVNAPKKVVFFFLKRSFTEKKNRETAPAKTHFSAFFCLTAVTGGLDSFFFLADEG